MNHLIGNSAFITNPLSPLLYIEHMRCDNIGTCQRNSILLLLRTSSSTEQLMMVHKDNGDIFYYIRSGGSEITSPTLQFRSISIQGGTVTAM